jgi:hypothetical protein
MRHVKRYNELFEAQMELTPEQIKWLDKCTNGKWNLNPQTGIVDVKGDFDCSDLNLTDFKGVRFGVVTGRFDCSNNSLTSLEGAPQKVGKSFYCEENFLTSLEGAPQEVGKGFGCSNNSLTSLEGAPQKVGRHFGCSDNELTSLKGAPTEVGYNFFCSNNMLTSLVGAPKKVGPYFICSNNSLTSLEGAPLSGGLYGFEAEENPVSERTLKGIYKKIQSGLSWPDAVASYWGYIKYEEDKIMLAQYNPKLSPEDVKGYQALAKFRNKII